MISWRLFKLFPKLVISGALLLVSSGLFLWWWMFASPARREAAEARAEAHKQIIAKKAALAEERMGRLFLADNDLYDVDTGELIFNNWLPETPSHLFYDARVKKIYAMVPNGILRFNLDGSRDGHLLLGSKIGFSKDFKKVLFVRKKDIWEAELNIEELKLENERQMTTTGVIDERYFIDNLVMITDKVLVVRHQNQQLRVERATGAIKQAQIPLDGIDKRRSPSGRYLIGEMNRSLYIYDVETEELKRQAVKDVADFQWLDDDRCLVLVMGKELMMFDRKTDKLELVKALPFHCHAVGAPSEDKRYVFCGNHQVAAMIDLQAKTGEVMPAGGQGYVWVNNDTVLFMRDVLDTELRGSWIVKPQQNEQRIADEPYVMNRQAGPIILLLKQDAQVIGATKRGIFRMSFDNNDFKPLVRLGKPPGVLMGISNWMVGSNTTTR